jgi:hypothetical protein
MSTPHLTFDPAEGLTLFFRIARAGSKKFVFKNEDDSPYAISASTWQLNIKKESGSVTNVLQLLPGTGLTIGGAGNNEITVSVSEATSNLAERSYYWELFNDTTNITWLNGQAYFYTGVVDTSDSVTDITIDLGETTVEITVENAINSVDGGTL